jgi:integrase
VSAILNAYEADRRLAGIPGLSRLIDAHKPLRRVLGQATAQGLTADQCYLYIRHRANAGRRPSTIRTEMQALRAALRWAATTKRWIATAPDVPLPPRSEPRARWLTRDEADRLLAACVASHVRLFVTIALMTAARRGAILDLTWDRVDLDAGLIDFRVPGKAATKKRQVMTPINDTLRAALVEARQVSTCAAVVEWAGRPVASVRKGVDEAARRAGLHGVTPHVFRHTAVTWMIQSGVPVFNAAAYAGMTPAMVEQVYGHHSPDHLRGAARSLG